MILITLPGVTGIVDNMIFYSKTELEHDTNLILLLETNRNIGLWLNKQKLQFKCTEVSFFRHKCDSTGISTDSKKVETILQMNFLDDKETMHYFLGLVNFFLHDWQNYILHQEN